MKVTYLSGGVGGAKLALGLSRLLPPAELTIIANTGDDFEHLGLPICPDIDTLVYTLSGLSNQAQGWGREDETGHFMETISRLGGPDWFYLGDRDLAMHHARRALMADGLSLTAITARLATALGVDHPILPMCDTPAPTLIDTVDGRISFQDYFVRLRAVPVVKGFAFHGDQEVRPSEAVLDAVSSADLIVIGPSNPLISIEPILSLADFREALRAAAARVIAVSPIVGGDAIKGPTAKMMRELGETVSVAGIAERYRDVVDHLVIDRTDADLASEVQHHIGKVSVTRTVMRSLEDRIDLARHVLAQG